jgi:hypothetical protein
MPSIVKLKPDREIWRETAAEDRGRPILVVLHARYITVRVKGTQESYNVPWDHLLDRARIVDATNKLREKLRA